MKTLTVEQIVASNKAAAAELEHITGASLAGFEKLVALNIATTKAALQNSASDFLAILGAANPNDALAAQSALVKPLTEKSVAYGRSVYEIATQSTALLTKALEEKLAESQKAMVEYLDTLASNAPAGGEPAIAAFKSALVAGQSAIESAQSSARKAVDLAEKQVVAATDSALGLVKATPRKK
jgi:phasin family protein